MVNCWTQKKIWAHPAFPCTCGPLPAAKKGEINTKQTAWLLYSHTRTDPSSSGWSVENAARACLLKKNGNPEEDEMLMRLMILRVLCFQTGSQHVFNFVELLSVVQIHRWLAQYAGSELMRKRWGRTWVFCAFSSDWWIIFSDLTGPSVWDWKSVAELSFEFR